MASETSNSSADTASRLKAVRERIDATDAEILRLLSVRARCAQEVAEIKAATGPQSHFYRPEREAEILRRIKAENPGPLHGEEVARLFREIMSACLALEKPLSVAYLGPEGTFTQAAALKHFGHSVRSLPFGAIGDIFREVEAGACHFGVVPVENSTEGVVSHTLDTFMQSPLSIVGEVTLRIHHHLMSQAVGLDGVKRVYSHQQSLAQCRAWLDRHLPHAERIPVGSNAEAARMAANTPDAGAVAGEAAAELYRLNLLANRIEDDPRNTSRFLIIGPEDAPPSGKDKTSLLLSCRNEAGGLFRLLTPLAEHAIDMTRIESRPSRQGVWDYVFFVDLCGHRDTEQVAAALAKLKASANLFKVLGSYPEAVL
ncbi:MULTISPECIES: prephenate dehydratase [Thiorhodovibrio]|uniref:prephenate dehydratase n=1 Tax=Thiorhodovibrio TaxID=61593 RepID=UPI0019133C58|nr:MULTISPECIES: prephenate dehydratase [Thiorhodovibrio]MBK5970546.1 chorismate mutase [Thiorhodovibrio winogradskyi]WPL12828.1 P-protein [Thiorhodovibrio litoralis]